MSNAFIQAVEGVAAQIGQIFKTSLPSYVDIETADTDQALVTGKGTLVSGIRIDGVRFAIGPEEFEGTVNEISRVTTARLSGEVVRLTRTDRTVTCGTWRAAASAMRVSASFWRTASSGCGSPILAWPAPSMTSA